MSKSKPDHQNWASRRTSQTTAPLQRRRDCCWQSARRRRRSQREATDASVAALRATNTTDVSAVRAEMARAGQTTQQTRSAAGAARVQVPSDAVKRWKSKMKCEQINMNELTLTY